ncbi:MAG: alpha/beta hydrolase [Gemmatimonadota bacterium]
MWKRIVGAVTALLSVFFAVLVLLLARPNDMIEFFAGIVGGSVPMMQLIFSVVALALFGVSRWVDAAPPLLVRIGHASVLAFIGLAVIGTSWREFSAYSRTTTDVMVDGSPRSATIYRPRGSSAEARPGVVIVHGSGNSKRGAYHFLARRFAEHGFVVLNVDKRGVGGSAGRYWGDDLEDGKVMALRAHETSVALETLAALRGVDPKRIGVVTISQGGWVMSSLLDGTSRAQFAINISGPAVSPHEEGVWSRWTDENTDHFGVKPPPIPFEELDRRMLAVPPKGFDPRANLAHMERPSLWLYGAWDSSLPVTKSIAVLDSLPTPNQVTWRLFPEANHGLFVVRGPNGNRMASFAPGVWDTVFAWTARQGIRR